MSIRRDWRPIAPSRPSIHRNQAQRLATAWKPPTISSRQPKLLVMPKILVAHNQTTHLKMSSRRRCPTVTGRLCSAANQYLAERVAAAQVVELRRPVSLEVSEILYKRLTAHLEILQES